MNIAVSTIGWDHTRDAAVAEALRRAGISRIEIAPSRRWPRPLETTQADLVAYRAWWEAHGIDVIAVQSLTFARPELRLFGDDGSREATIEHLARMCQLAATMGAEVLVFGSPANRLVGDMDALVAREIAVKAFRRIARAADDAGVRFCIEPNPTAYGADFVTTAEEGSDLVREVDHAGFRLHLDAAAMTLAGDDPAAAIPAAADVLAHFHASEVNLAPFGTGSVDHASFASALRSIRYVGAVSVEMLVPGDLEPASVVERSAVGAQAVYGPVAV